MKSAVSATPRNPQRRSLRPKDAVGHHTGNGVKWDLPQEVDVTGCTFSRAFQSGEADAIIGLEDLGFFGAIGSCYEDFIQVSVEEVIEILKQLVERTPKEPA
jgi:hypothetical protein